MFKRFVLAAAAAGLALSGPGSAQTTPPEAPATTDVVITTELGAITVALETDRAPVTSANFLRYVDGRRLDGTTFYRAMRLDWGEQPNGLIQGGAQNDPKRLLPPIAHERTSDTGVKHLAGAISMARLAPGTATADFSIMLADQPGLDADPASADADLREGYAAFGRVTEGMDVVRAIFAEPLNPNRGEGWLKGQMIDRPVRIVTVRRAPAAAAAAP